jgi:hypothetical protein
MSDVIQLAPQPPGRGRPTKFTPERMQQIRNLVERGRSRDEIAEIIGVTTGTLQVTCSKLGISLRRPTFDTGTGLLLRRRSRSHRRVSSHQLISHSEHITSGPAKGPPSVSGGKPMGEAQAATAPEGARQGRSTDPAPAVLTIQMEYKGQERSTGIPFNEEAIAQLAMEAEIRGMQIRELVAALISAIIQKDLLRLVLQHHSVEQQQA